MSKDARSQAVNVLRQVLQFGQSLNKELPKAIEQTDKAQTALLQTLVLGSLRQFHYLDGRLRQYLKEPLKTKDTDIYCILLSAAYQLLFLDKPDYAVVNSAVELCRKRKKPWASKLVNAILRKLLREDRLAADAQLKPWQQSAHPKWIYQTLQNDWPQQAQALMSANNEQAPLVLRVNQRQQQRQDYLQKLQQHNIAANLCQWSETGLRLQQNIRPTELPGFEQGEVSIQDEAAQLCTQLLDIAKLPEGSRALDACAAPGGKTCHMLEQNPALDCLALDIDQQRLQRLHENIQRLQLSDCQLQIKTANAADLPQWWDGKCFDAILLDAPCSGTGVIRRHPDIKLLRKKADIDSLIETQQKLLQKLWQTLAVGGRMLYTSCSVFNAENSQQIENFLNQQQDAVLIPVDLATGIDTGFGHQLLSSPQGPDGFFYCLLEKQQQN